MPTDATDGRALSGHLAAVVLAAAVVAGAAATGLAFGQVGAPSGETILEDARERYESAETVAGTATVTVTDGSETRTYEVAFAATDENESRLSVDGPRRDVVVGSNGSAAWVHFERTGLTRVYTEAELVAAERGARTDGETDLDAAVEAALPGDASLDALGGNASVDEADLRALAWDWSRENATVERVGRETVDGTTAHVVEVRPDDGRNGTLTVWVAVDTSTVLKQRLADEDGVVTVRYDRTDFGVSIADSTFQPPTADVPDVGTRVDTFGALVEATSLSLPRLDAGGYAFAGGSTVAYAGETTVVQRYDGPATVTLVTTTADELPSLAGESETATVAGTTVSVVETERGVAVTWTEDDLRHAVISEQSRAAVLALAESVFEDGGAP